MPDLVTKEMLTKQMEVAKQMMKKEVEDESFKTTEGFVMKVHGEIVNTMRNWLKEFFGKLRHRKNCG